MDQLCPHVMQAAPGLVRAVCAKPSSRFIRDVRGSVWGRGFGAVYSEIHGTW